MVALRWFASLYVVVIALVGYGLGQLFFARFSLVDTICGTSAVLAVFASGKCGGQNPCRYAVGAICAISLVCILLGAIEYYRYYDIPGNNYAWPMRAPFALAVAFLGTRGFGIPTSDRPNKSPERSRDA